MFFVWLEPWKRVRKYFLKTNVYVLYRKITLAGPSQQFSTGSTNDIEAIALEDPDYAQVLYKQRVRSLRVGASRSWSLLLYRF